MKILGWNVNGTGHPMKREIADIMVQNLRCGLFVRYRYVEIYVQGLGVLSFLWCIGWNVNYLEFQNEDKT